MVNDKHEMIYFVDSFWEKIIKILWSRNQNVFCAPPRHIQKIASSRRRKKIMILQMYRNILWVHINAKKRYRKNFMKLKPLSNLCKFLWIQSVKNKFIIGILKMIVICIVCSIIFVFCKIIVFLVIIHTYFSLFWTTN